MNELATAVAEAADAAGHPRDSQPARLEVEVAVSNHDKVPWHRAPRVVLPFGQFGQWAFFCWPGYYKGNNDPVQNVQPKLRLATTLPLARLTGQRLLRREICHQS